MTTCTVRNQAELDAALADADVDKITITSPAGVWLELGTHDKSVRASGSASVHAFGSASVSAFGSASVRAFGSASVRAFGSASVSAFGSVSVHAFGSVSVHAFDSASVHASGSASVHAFDSASVHAGKYVSVHLHSQRVKLLGGVLIDMTQVDEHTITAWCDLQGVETTDGTAIVYKAVNQNLHSGYGCEYPIGGTVTAWDWAPTDACGAGLHFGPTPAHAEAYHDSVDAPRFLACRINLAEAVGITESGSTAKCKARSCEVLYEVDVHGRVLTAAGAS